MHSALVWCDRTAIGLRNLPAAEAMRAFFTKAMASLPPQLASPAAAAGASIAAVAVSTLWIRRAILRRNKAKLLLAEIKPACEETEENKQKKDLEPFDEWESARPAEEAGIFGSAAPARSTPPVTVKAPAAVAVKAAAPTPEPATCSSSSGSSNGTSAAAMNGHTPLPTPLPSPDGDATRQSATAPSATAPPYGLGLTPVKSMSGAVRYAEKDRNSTCAFADRVALTAIAAFRRHAARHGLEYKQTVMSGVVAVFRREAGPAHFTCISLGVG